MSPCTSQQKQGRLGCLIKKRQIGGGGWNSFTLSSECCGEVLLSLGSLSRDDLGKEWSQRLPLFSLPSLQSTTHEPSLEEGVET